MIELVYNGFEINNFYKDKIENPKGKVKKFFNIGFYDNPQPKYTCIFTITIDVILTDNGAVKSFIKSFYTFDVTNPNPNEFKNELYKAIESADSKFNLECEKSMGFPLLDQLEAQDYPRVHELEVFCHSMGI